ncbi:MAG: META domain-containing protein [Odoribacter sp.]
MKTMKWMTLVLLVMGAGCKEQDNSLALLRGQEWELKTMTESGKMVTNPQELPTLKFSDSTAVYGSAGCNRFFGTYTTGEKGKINIKPGGATMMFCPDMAFEIST